MRGGFLHVAQRHAGIERGGDERVPERVRADGLPIPARRATRRTIRAAPCRSSRRPSPARNIGPSVRSPMARSIARAVRGASGMVTTLPPLRVMARVRWPRSRPRCLDVGAGRLGHPQPVEGQQRDQRMLGRRPEPGGDQQRAELVAVQAGGMRLIVQPGTADVRGRRVIEQVFLDRVPVEPGDGAQPPGHRGPGPAAGFQVAGEALDVGAAGLRTGAGSGCWHQPVYWRRSSA